MIYLYLAGIEYHLEKVELLEEDGSDFVRDLISCLEEFQKDFESEKKNYFLTMEKRRVLSYLKRIRDKAMEASIDNYF
ncbi:MAG: hypothetical protein R6V40_04665 [Candidatus Moraniibacteriota bacterium]